MMIRFLFITSSSWMCQGIKTELTSSNQESSQSQKSGTGEDKIIDWLTGSGQQEVGGL